MAVSAQSIPYGRYTVRIKNFRKPFGRITAVIFGRNDGRKLLRSHTTLKSNIAPLQHLKNTQHLAACVLCRMLNEDNIWIGLKNCIWESSAPLRSDSDPNTNTSRSSLSLRTVCRRLSWTGPSSLCLPNLVPLSLTGTAPHLKLVPCSVNQESIPEWLWNPLLQGKLLINN